MRPQPSPSDKWISNENSDLNEQLIKPVQDCLSTQTGRILSQKKEREMNNNMNMESTLAGTVHAHS